MARGQDQKKPRIARMTSAAEPQPKEYVAEKLGQKKIQG
jgi:hypothetical protein